MRRDAFVFLVLMALSLLFFLLTDGASAEESRPTSFNELSGEVALEKKMPSSKNDYTVPRKQVILELGTGTWCGGCTYAAVAADSLKKLKGDAVAIFSYHASDTFESPDGVGRIRYYLITSFPTTLFDGTDRLIGANPGTINTYKNFHNQHMLINTPGVLSVKVDYDSSTRTGEIITKMNSVDEIIESDLHLRYAVTESHKYYPWQWLDSLQFIVRDMLPDSVGMSFVINQGETYVDTQGFYMDTSWVDYNCDLVVYVQSDMDTNILISNSIPIYQIHLSGDANSDGVVTVSDVVFLTNYILYSGPEPEPSAAGDPNEDCVIDNQDIVYLCNYLFNQGLPPLRGWEID
jgi:thiol-disulfide isomerase/thioredoxin